MAKSFKPKPLIDATLITEFGCVEDMEQFKAEGPQHHDYLYVPGASDMRYERDLDIGRLYRGEIQAKDVKTLDWNVRWFRTVKGAGSEPDNIRTVAAQNQGYRPATEKDIGQPWLRAMPPGARKAPDGTIRSAGGDLALFVADKQVAARNAMRKKIRAEESVQGLEFSDGGLGSVGGRVKGAEPFVEKKIGKEATK